MRSRGFPATCEAALAGAEHGLGALAPYPQTEGPDPQTHGWGDSLLGGILGVWWVIYDHSPQSSGMGELEQKGGKAVSALVCPPGAALTPHKGKLASQGRVMKMILEKKADSIRNR